MTFTKVAGFMIPSPLYFLKQKSLVFPFDYKIFGGKFKLSSTIHL